MKSAKPRKSYKSEALVLRTYDYGESDRIVVLYTLDYGKIRGIAKGAKRSTRRFANILESFSQINVLFSRRPHDGLFLIEEGSIINHFRGIRSDLKKTLFSSYILDLADNFTPENKPQGELFTTLVNFLNVLDYKDVNEYVLHIFELKLLKLAGYKPHLETCLVCKESLKEGKRYCFIPREGGIKCSSCFTQDSPAYPALSAGTIKMLLLGSTAKVENLWEIVVNEETTKEARLFLDRFIGELLGKEIKSLHVLREVSRLGIA